MKKNLLMLNWMYPPANHMAGRRAYGFSKYLKKYGWHSYVCTTQVQENQDFTGGIDPKKQREIVENQSVLRVPFKTNKSYSIVRRIPRYLRTILCPTTQPFDYYLNSMRMLPSFIAKNNIRLIWASYPPPAPLHVAYNLHKKYKIPWIADFRDFWDQRYMYNRYFSLRQALSITKYINTCSSIVAVSPAICEKLKMITDTPVSLIYNGYDPEEYPTEHFIERNEESIFKIVYTGSILAPPMRNPAPVFRAIDLLLERGAIDRDKFRIVFYGSNTELLKSLLGNGKCRDVCFIQPSIPHSQVVRVQQEATVLLHLSHSGEKGIMTGKIFEYLAARRPILSVPGDGDCVEKLLNFTRAGCCKTTIEEIAEQVKSWYNNKIQVGSVSYTGVHSEIEKYSYMNLAKELTDILDQVPT